MVSPPSTRHTLEFYLPVSASTATDLRNPDKTKLNERILTLRAAGWSYRQIGREVGLHWTRVGQILTQHEFKRSRPNEDELQ
jgi:hypothetical protein